MLQNKINNHAILYFLIQDQGHFSIDNIRTYDINFIKTGSVV